MKKINIIKNFNKKKKIIFILGVLLLILIIAIIALYISEKGFRDWIDVNILRKNVTEDDTQTINLNTDKNNQIHVFGKYIAILNDKAITLFNSYGEKVSVIDGVNINSALFDSSDKYLAIAENRGHELCLILDKTYLWNTAIEGEILQIHVNQNGYVAVVTTDVTNKSIITCFNSEGKKLFTSYFSTTTIIDASISNDNKNIVIGEVDTSGTIIKSSIKILSIENAQKDAENTIIYTYNLEDSSLLTNVQYHDKNQISCVYDNGIGIINNKEYKQIIKIDNDNITYAANNFKSNVVYIVEESLGMFKSTSNVHIVNVSDNHDNVYKLENTAKEVYAIDNKLAINCGSEIYFINTSGWLIKKYNASQEITNVKMSNSLAAIIYKDKIVILEI